MLTQAEIEAIHKRAEKATNGPWSVKDTTYFLANNDEEIGEIYIDADADFIAHTREDIPKLLAEIDRLRKFEKKVTSPIDVEGIAEDGTVVKLKNVVFEFDGGDGE